MTRLRPLLTAGLLLAGGHLGWAEGKCPPAAAGKKTNAPRSFDKRPPNGTRMSCAVSGEEFTVGEETKFATHEGRTYGFCCPECQPAFVKNPAKFADKK